MGLVFDIDDIERLAWSPEVTVPVAAPTQLLSAVGSEVLLAGRAENGARLAVARGRLGWIGQNEVLLTDLRWFVQRVPLAHTEPGPYALSAAEHEALSRRGFSAPPGAREAGTGFDAGPAPGLAHYPALYHAVLRNHGHACALTGRRFVRGEAVHDGLEVVAIVPLAAGGPLHVRNFLPMVPAAAEAFYRLHLAVAADLAIIVDLSAIDPELGVSLDVGGRLLVPAEPAHGPASDLLAWHRARFFERLGR